MTTTKVKNDTASVTAAIMTVDVNKETGKKPTAKAKPKAKVKPKAVSAPAKAEEKKADGKETEQETVLEKKEDTAVVMSTDAFSREILTEYYKRTKAIKSSIGKIDSSFESIAFNLHWINAKQAFKSEGFASIVEYAVYHFGYQKSTCYSLIAVVDRFAKRDAKGTLTESLDDRIKGFSVSKLSLMVNLTDAEIATLNPSMSVSEIKKFVKGLQGKALPELSEGDGENEDTEDVQEQDTGGTEDENIVDGKGTVVYDVLISCKGKDDFDKKADRINEYVQRVFNRHPDAIIEVSYSLPSKNK